MTNGPGWEQGLVAAAALVSAILAVPRYVEGLQVAFDPAEWFPLKVHRARRVPWAIWSATVLC